MIPGASKVPSRSLLDVDFRSMMEDPGRIVGSTLQVWILLDLFTTVRRSEIVMRLYSKLRTTKKHLQYHSDIIEQQNLKFDT